MIKRMLAASLAALTISTLASAQVASPDARVSLRVEGRALSEVVEFIRARSGANIVILEGGSEAISLELTDVPWRDALDFAAEQAGSIVEERAAGVLVIDDPPRVDFVFKNQEISDVIDNIAAISGANVVVAPEVAGLISLRLKNVPWRHALEVAVKTLGYTVVEEERGVLRVVDPLTLQTQMETRSYQLRYVRPRSTYAPVIDSEFLTGESKPGTGNLEDDFPILEALRKALSPSGELDYVSSQNVIIVRDTRQVHEAIKVMIERLDIKPAQVFVDVKFVSTSLTDLHDLGVDYGDTGPQISTTFGQIPITLPFNLGSGGWEDSIIANPAGEGPFADPSLNAGPTFIPETIFGELDFTGITATLKALQRDTTTEVIQAPKIITLDGQPATIFVGETVRYAEAKSEQGQAGGLQLSIAEAQGSPVETGFQLLVVPHVVPGSNSLTMEVIPKETSLSGTGQSALAPPGFDVFTIGASGLEGSIALPRERSSTIVTNMLLDSGQTAMIGGLTTDSDSETYSQVPLLGDIPIIGWAFRHETLNRDRRSLLVFVTPTIVRTSRDSERILQEELDRRRDIYEDRLDELLYGTTLVEADAQVESIPYSQPEPPPAPAEIAPVEGDSGEGE